MNPLPQAIQTDIATLTSAAQANVDAVAALSTAQTNLASAQAALTTAQTTATSAATALQTAVTQLEADLQTAFPPTTPPAPAARVEVHHNETAARSFWAGRFT